MYKKMAVCAGILSCVSSGSNAQSAGDCPAGAVSCTISVQDAGRNDTSSAADNTNTTSSQAGVSSASNASGVTIDPTFDHSAQTTQNATTTTGAVTSEASGNSLDSDNRSNASNGNQSMGQVTNGNSSIGDTSSMSGSMSGGNEVTATNSNGSVTNGDTSLSNGPNTNTNSVGGSDAKVGNLSTGASTSGSLSGAYSGPSKSLSSADNNGGNSTNRIDASSHYKSRTVFIPPVVPGTPPSQLAVGNIIRETSACGPLQSYVRRPVTGTFIGLFRNSSIPQGWSDDLEPYRDETGARVDYRQVVDSNGDIRLFGHQVIMFTTVIGVASNRNIALGGGGGGGGWGQGGMGSSSSNQRLVTNIQLRECEIGTLHPVMVEVPPKAIRQ